MPRWARWTLGGLGLLVLASVLAAAGDVVEMVLVSALLAYVLDPLVRRLEGRGLGRTAATTVVFGGLLLGTGLVLAAFWPTLVAQVVALQNLFTVERAGMLLHRLETWLTDHLAFAGVERVNLTASLQETLLNGVRWFVAYVPDLLGLLANMILIPFLLFFLLKDGPALRTWFIGRVPNRFFEFTLTLLYRMDQQLGNYLRGKLVATLVVGVLSTAALWGLGVAGYLLLGPVAGVLNLIPYVGPAVALVMTLVVALAGGSAPPVLAGITVAYLLIQAIDNVVVNPLVVARNVSLHPVVVLLVVVVGGKFFGVLGLLLAIPAAAVVKVVVQETLWGCRRYRLV
ncbi:MAG: AI-2E family transporter [Rhodothermaceae bacterium]|nr:MAG: AI-2E family transporter [Rhodothermaceae bacterium]